MEKKFGKGKKLGLCSSLQVNATQSLNSEYSRLITRIVIPYTTHYMIPLQGVKTLNPKP